ncbi:PhnD/SsuA/transferrin family substrate-binding protein [Sulfitobacter sp. BDSS02]|nr:PhnD/SsuA/transferrin family substrate-binding protein [Sulfitobacter sp. BDSS02]MBR9848303.1 PhnD/SsuA/transferrin family substrate-binding protein [Paracoccaceae bacterium]
MIAMLGMYDMPEIQQANDRYWQEIRARLGYGPENLSRDLDYWDMWQSPDLLLGQTCGMPYRTRLYDKVNLIGTPDFGLPDCPPGYYQSVIVARADNRRDTPQDFDGARFAYNEDMSQSGWAGPLHFLTGLRFSEMVPTGGHRLSLHAVAEGRADIAGIDAVTWLLLCEHDPLAAKLKVIAKTKPTPGLPYITAQDRDPAPIAEAAASAIANLNEQDRKALHLRGLVRIETADYLSVPTPQVVWA